MAVITPVAVSRAGLATSGGAAASAGGDSFLNDGKTLFMVMNGGGSPITITETLPSTAVVDGQLPASRTVTVAAGERTLIGPFPTAIYSDTLGYMNIAYSGVTSVTVKAIQIPAA